MAKWVRRGALLLRPTPPPPRCARKCVVVGDMCNEYMWHRIASIPGVRSVAGIWPVYEVEHLEAVGIARALKTNTVVVKPTESTVLSVMPPLNQSFNATREELIQLEIELCKLVRRPPPATQERADAPARERKLSYADAEVDEWQCMRGREYPTK